MQEQHLLQLICVIRTISSCSASRCEVSDAVKLCDRCQVQRRVRCVLLWFCAWLRAVDLRLKTSRIPGKQVVCIRVSLLCCVVFVSESLCCAVLCWSACFDGGWSQVRCLVRTCRTICPQKWRCGFFFFLSLPGADPHHHPSVF